MKTLKCLESNGVAKITIVNVWSKKLVVKGGKLFNFTGLLREFGPPCLIKQFHFSSYHSLCSLNIRARYPSVVPSFTLFKRSCKRAFRDPWWVTLWVQQWKVLLTFLGTKSRQRFPRPSQNLRKERKREGNLGYPNGTHTHTYTHTATIYIEREKERVTFPRRTVFICSSYSAKWDSELDLVQFQPTFLWNSKLCTVHYRVGPCVERRYFKLLYVHSSSSRTFKTGWGKGASPQGDFHFDLGTFGHVRCQMKILLTSINGIPHSHVHTTSSFVVQTTEGHCVWE